MSPRRAFTVIELLVIIAILAMLVSLLMPSLGRARDAANDAICVSNQRQVHTAIRSYTVEFSGYLPWNAWGGNEWPDDEKQSNVLYQGWTNWWYRVGQVPGDQVEAHFGSGSLSLREQNLRQIWSNGYIEWRRNNWFEGPFKCPTAIRQIEPQWHAVTRFDAHFGMNGHLLGSQQRSFPWSVKCTRLSDVPRRLVLTADSHISLFGPGGYYFWDSHSLNPYWTAYYPWPLQHLKSSDSVNLPGHLGGTANVAWTDGSVTAEEVLTWEDYMTR